MSDAIVAASDSDLTHVEVPEQELKAKTKTPPSVIEHAAIIIER
jgi:hypothetical protein